MSMSMFDLVVPRGLHDADKLVANWQARYLRQRQAPAPRPTFGQLRELGLSIGEPIPFAVLDNWFEDPNVVAEALKLDVEAWPLSHFGDVETHPSHPADPGGGLERILTKPHPKEIFTSWPQTINIEFFGTPTLDRFKQGEIASIFYVCIDNYIIIVGANQITGVCPCKEFLETTKHHHWAVLTACGPHGGALTRADADLAPPEKIVTDQFEDYKSQLPLLIQEFVQAQTDEGTAHPHVQELSTNDDTDITFPCPPQDAINIVVEIARLENVGITDYAGLGFDVPDIGTDVTTSRIELEFLGRRPLRIHYSIDGNDHVQVRPIRRLLHCHFDGV